MDATIFYAWQSDRPAKANRYLIRDAAKAACERITDDSSNSWSLTLDSDTQGVAGMCDIPNTILEKIERCDIFLADLTFVGNTEESDEPKQIPNANVLFELGYAAKCLDFDSLVGVVNEAFGTIQGQVFDIKRRASLAFNVVSDATGDDRKKECDRLSRRLEEVFRTTLDTVVAQRRAQASQDADIEFRRLQTQCSARILDGKFHGFRKRPATLITIQSNVSVLMFDDLFNAVRAKGLNPKPHEESID